MEDVERRRNRLRISAKRARDVVTSASTVDAGVAARALKRAVTPLASMRRRLESGVARVRIEPDARGRLVDATAAALARVRALRATL